MLIFLTDDELNYNCVSQKGTTLFSIPRPLTLSARTSTLPELVGEKAWKQLQLNKGWVGLILCMMWEEAQGEKSKWSEYLSKFN